MLVLLRWWMGWMGYTCHTCATSSLRPTGWSVLEVWIMMMMAIRLGWEGKSWAGGGFGECTCVFMLVRVGGGEDAAVKERKHMWHADWSSRRLVDHTCCMPAAFLPAHSRRHSQPGQALIQCVYLLGCRFEFTDILGHVFEFALDQHGSRFIQQVGRQPAADLVE